MSHQPRLMASEGTRLERRVRPAAYLIIAACAIAALLACTSVTRLASAPASALMLEVQIQHALVPGDRAQVSIGVFRNGDPVVFTGGQRVAVNGVTLPERDSGDQHTAPTREAEIARQSPGGKYTVTYTDEQGRQISVDIPAPQADFVVLDPAAEARVPIPPPIATAAPTPSTSANPAPDVSAIPTSNRPRPPEFADAPLTIRYTLPYALDALPAPSSHDDRPVRFETTVLAFGTCPGQAPSQCGPILGGEPTATGTCTISDQFTPYGKGFDSFEPGAGKLDVSFVASWSVPQPGFASLHVEIADSAMVPITWSRP